MIIFRLSGGFGNQLWSFAAGYQLAKETGDVYALDTSTQEAPWFFRNYDIAHYNIEFDKKICYPLGDRKIDHLFWNHFYRRRSLGLFTPTIEERDKEHYDPEILAGHKKGTTVYYVGDWQHLQYFEKYQDDIRRMYVYKEKLSVPAAALKAEMSDNPRSVAVHVRRGDYVKIGIAHNEEYYRSAVQRMAELLGEGAVFYCFSEDLEWVRKAFNGLDYDFRYMDYTSEMKDLEDFELMRVCSHQIISRSTYSWWAAWLNENRDKRVIYPQTNNYADKKTWSEKWICI
ncbi:MAG: alpha-1,2-fucosyltransferase [Lachnospiraceae bacterium]|nr:alpha-1,2-fucosyltransferase [Lachnospiraceae bacterium]